MKDGILNEPTLTKNAVHLYPCVYKVREHYLLPSFPNT